MPPSDRDIPYPREQVFMRVGMRSGRVLAGPGRAIASSLPGLERRAARVLEHGAGTWLLAFETDSPFEQASELALELKALVPPVAVALDAACLDPATSGVADLAAVEAIARPGEVLATEAFWRLARERFSFEPVTNGVYRLGGPKPALQDVLVGRHAEWRHLLACWDTARLGRPLIVSIQGEPGIGKSRFLGEFLSEGPSGARIVTACARENEQHRPYAVLACLLSALGLSDGSLSELLGPEGADLDYLVGSLASADALQPRHRQFRAFKTMNRLLQSRLGETPTVFAFEDLHWADEASLLWLDFLVAELAAAETPPPWLFLLTERGGDLYRRYAGLGIGAMTIGLAPLSEPEARDLVTAVAPDLEAGLLDSVLARSQGNPLFLREFARLAQEVGQTASIPTTLRRELGHRLSARIPLERQLLERAAILGPTFDLGLLARLVEAPGFRQLVANLAGSGLLRLEGSTGAFAHHLLYEAAYGGMAEPRRQELHSLVAHLMESEGAGPSDLAYHLVRGLQPAQARPHLLRAAHDARQRHAVTEARGLLAAARDAGSRTDRLDQTIRLELADVLLTAGELEAARRELEAVHPVVSDDLRLRLCLLRGQLDERRGDYPSALAALHEGLASALPAPPTERARLILAEANLHLRRGEFDACRSLARQALEAMEETPSLERALAHSLEGIATYRLDGPERALGAYHSALADREAVGDPAAIAGSQSNLGIAYYELGRWDEAHQAFERALETFRSIGERWQSTVVLNNMGHLLLNRGQLDEAERCYREALAIKREMGEEPGVAITLGNLGNALSHRGSYEAARACLHEAALLFERVGEEETQAELYQVYGLMELAAGEHERARALLQRALDKSRSVLRDVPRAIALRGLSQLAALEERWDEARALAWESVQLNDRVQNPLELGRSLVALGRAYQALGDIERAMDAVDKASVLFRQLGALPDMRAIVSLLD